ncbi:MAG: hypothetical protein FWD23_17180 [Oscillospiraceae bacterium]|nr:hypothetical protein [Oscillospiraceae bacterium]
MKKSAEKTAVAAGIYSFSDIVDNACQGLRDRQAKYSIRRIAKMKDFLNVLERELDAFLEGRTEN